MKRNILGFLFFGSLAFATDGGYVLVKVKGINPDNGKVGDENVVAQAGTRFSFPGAAAYNIFKRIPSFSNITETSEKEFRELKIESKSWNLSIVCELGLKDPEIKPEHKSDCQITFAKNVTTPPTPDDTPIDYTHLKYLDFEVPDDIRNQDSLLTNSIHTEIVAGENSEQAKLPKDGTKITFYGKDVEQLLRILPDSKSLKITQEKHQGLESTLQLEIACKQAKEAADSSCSLEYKVLIDE